MNGPMQIILEENGQRQKLRLTQRAVIGSGGEATVFKHRQRAIKVYHLPSPARARKLEDFVQARLALPPQVVAPLGLAHENSRQRPVMGFSMHLLDSSVQDVSRLASKKARLIQHIATRDVAEIFLSGHATLERLHRCGLVVGDFNEFNVLFPATKDRMFFVDVDSFQFGPHPCMVGSEGTLDPNLYGIDLSLKPVFTPENDWYSFAVLLFRSLLLVHPYGGVHKNLKTLISRAQHRLPVWTDDVRYPKNGLPVQVLSDDLFAVFARYFAQGWRGPFPRDVLDTFRHSLTTCPTCDAQYHASRADCPVCTQQTGLAQMMLTPSQPQAGEQAVMVEMLIQSPGVIVFCTTQGRDLIAVAHEGGRAVLLQKQFNRPVARTDLFEAVPGAAYALLDNVLVVAPEPSQPHLMLIDLSGRQPKGLMQTTSGLLEGQGIVFGASQSALFRLTGESNDGYLMRGELWHGVLKEKQVMQTSTGQTWFTVSAASSGTPEMVFGAFRVFNHYSYFLRVAQQQYTDLPLPPLEIDEALDDLHALFASDSVLVLRQTRQQGVRYIRLAEISTQGKITYAARHKRSEAPAYQNPRSLIYQRGTVIYPTDDGLVNTQIATQKQYRFEATAAAISAEDRLLPYERGVLVIKPDRVLRLMLG